MGDVLSASSVLLAILAVVYGVWQPEITAALGLKMPAEVADRGAEQDTLKSILRSKAIPLTLAAWTIALVFAPRALDLAVTVVRCIGSKRCQYDDVRAGFITIEVLLIALAAISSFQVWKLRAKLSASKS